MESLADQDMMDYRSALDARVSHDTIRDLGRQGLSVVSISQKTGVARVSIERVLNGAGIKVVDDALSRPPTAPHRFSHRDAVAAVRAGESLASVGRRLGVTASSVAYVVRRAAAEEEPL